MLSPRRKSQPEDEFAQTGDSEGRRGLLRRIRSHQPSPEERLEGLLAEHRREIDEHAATLEQTLADLEGREERLRDSKAAVERLLRLGQKDLDARESDLVRLARELAERESRIRDEEAELTQRRAELGAVELKRAALEQRERTLDAREGQLEALGSDETGDERDPFATHQHTDAASPLLLLVPGPGYRLIEIAREPLSDCEELELDGVNYVVARVGPSPLPGDTRRCAYLVRGEPGLASSGGSS
jgi:chromosome segregation ATPase